MLNLCLRLNQGKQKQGISNFSDNDLANYFIKPGDPPDISRPLRSQHFEEKHFIFYIFKIDNI